MNWEISKRLEKIEKERGEHANLKSVPEPKYNTEDTTFKQLIETIAFSTTSFFSYKPLSDEIRAQVARNMSLRISQIPQEVD